MLRVALLAIAALAAMPSVAFPCENGVEYHVNPEVELLTRAERYIESAKYQEAQTTLDNAKLSSARLRQRADDIRAIVRLRTRGVEDDVRDIVEHFESRTSTRAGQRSVRLRAWLAEAYVASGMTDEARTILHQLKKRDVMPDAFAYVTLARVSEGRVRIAALAACRSRAATKSVCTTESSATSMRLSN